MRRVGYVLLVPFWLAGFTVGVCIVGMLAMWHAAQAGYRDITKWAGE